MTLKYKQQLIKILKDRIDAVDKYSNNLNDGKALLSLSSAIQALVELEKVEVSDD